MELDKDRTISKELPNKTGSFVGIINYIAFRASCRECIRIHLIAPVFLSSVLIGQNKAHSGEHRTAGHITTKPISSVIR